MFVDHREKMVMSFKKSTKNKKKKKQETKKKYIFFRDMGHNHFQVNREGNERYMFLG